MHGSHGSPTIYNGSRAGSQARSPDHGITASARNASFNNACFLSSFSLSPFPPLSALVLLTLGTFHVFTVSFPNRHVREWIHMHSMRVCAHVYHLHANTHAHFLAAYGWRCMDLDIRCCCFHPGGLSERWMRLVCLQAQCVDT